MSVNNVTALLTLAALLSSAVFLLSEMAEGLCSKGYNIGHIYCARRDVCIQLCDARK